MPEPIDIVEGLLFAYDVPLEAERIREVLDLASVAEVHAVMADGSPAARAACRSATRMRSR